MHEQPQKKYRIPMSLTKTKGYLLVVEDDKKTAELVRIYLEREGFNVSVRHDGQDALEMARRNNPLLMILDIMLPGLDGWEVCRELRRNSNLPIIMLTARDDEIDRISGLTLGADDYVAKPFSPRELVARVKAVLRRTAPRPISSNNRLMSAGLILDPEKRTVMLDSRPLTLTPHEYTLLKALMTAPGRVFTRDELLDKIYPDKATTVIDRVIDVHIGKLRQKIEADLSKPEFILTVRGVGYQFNDREQAR
jgi:DNA-binding response OmpR family regulator